MLVYLALRVASVLVPLLPASIGYRLASVGGELFYFLRPRLRRNVEDNLRRVLRDAADDGQWRAAVHEVFRTQAKNLYDLFRLPKLQVAALEELVEVQGWEHVEAALEAGRGMVAAVPHLGNLEVVSHVAVARSKPLTVPVERLRPEALFRLMMRLRTRWGLKLVPLDSGALRALHRALRRNEIVGIAADRDIQKIGARVHLFGEETTIPDAPVVLALRTGAKLVPVCMTRRKTGFRLDIYPPLRLVETGDTRQDVQVNTQRLATVLEGMIRQHPGQWVVFEPVWDAGPKGGA